MTNVSDRAGFSERFIGTAFVDCLETTRRNANAYKLFQLRHPNTLPLQVRRENTRPVFRDMSAYTALLLSQATPVNDAAAHGF
jgi:hypothetical protein